jgi:hypothetical protein
MTQGKLKLKLLWEIVRNLGRLLSGDFWYKTLTDEDFEAWSYVKIIFMSAAADIFLVCSRSDYPDLDPKDD